MRVYHFLSESNGLDDLRRRRLKIATIEAANDPFELSSVALDTPARKKAWGDFKMQMTLRFGFLCFSRDWHNPVQWSHYADRHRGLCLGFDIPDALAMPVKYRKTRYKAALLDHFDDALAKMILTTKYKHWEYEQEVRIFADLDERDPDSGMYFKEFDEEMVLREVIVGHRAMLTRKDVASALGSLASGVKAFRATLALHSYSMVEQRNDEMWV
jgi:hypothetical protein